MDNLASRLADLPKEVPADLIYNQIRLEIEKVKELETVQNHLAQRRTELSTQAIDRDGLLFRIRRTIANLEKTPVEHRRSVYGNLIKFAEMHSTKIKIGVYAPTIAPDRVGSCNVTRSATGGT